MKLIRIVVVMAVDKDGTIAKTFRKHLPTNIEEADTFANVTTNLFNGRITIDVGEYTKTESIHIHTRICIAIDDNIMSVFGMKHFTNSLLQLKIVDRAPMWRLLVRADRSYGSLLGNCVYIMYSVCACL